eukprot:TRINITY_DN3488_c0_g1_i2.p1 TRINITY_DN3488_c0_g1~~TRINITY_DN3488_c0_g1_i2.p1  ORF type:complete len:464 (+),score=124.87 TRINITY_DN3488_c0_g1_i2:85-1476(+)
MRQDGVGRWVSGFAGQRRAVLVDGFAVRPAVHDGVACREFFLTHFHSDHYWGLRSSFAGGTIYCSPITAALVASQLHVEKDRLVVLEAGRRHTLPDVGLVVTPLDANHCPGAVMFLFEPLPEQPYAIGLHTGDFRAAAVLTDAVRDALGARGLARLDRLWMDTTYALPPGKWRLPPQDDVLRGVAAWCRARAASHPGTLFVVGMYAIGKERVLEAVAEGAGDVEVTPATDERAAMLTQCGYARLLGGAGAAPARVVAAGLREVSRPEVLEGFLTGPHGAGATSVVGFHCSGWRLRRDQVPVLPDRHAAIEQTQPACLSLDDDTAVPKFPTWMSTSGRATVVQVPYSEHSSWDELLSFVAATKPKELVPTVAQDAAARRRIVDALRGPQQTSLHRFVAPRQHSGACLDDTGDGDVVVIEPPTAPASARPPRNSDVIVIDGGDDGVIDLVSDEGSEPERKRRRQG